MSSYSFTKDEVVLLEQIIRVSQARGAFQIAEASLIAPLYAKITDILKPEEPATASSSSKPVTAGPVPPPAPATQVTGSKPAFNSPWAKPTA